MTPFEAEEKRLRAAIMSGLLPALNEIQGLIALRNDDYTQRIITELLNARDAWLSESEWPEKAESVRQYLDRQQKKDGGQPCWPVDASTQAFATWAVKGQKLFRWHPSENALCLLPV